MSEDLKRLIKVFCFDEPSRAGITLSDATKIRLNTEGYPGHAQLNGGFEDVDPFPLDTDLTVRTRLTTPNGIKQWLFIEILRDEPADTLMQYRIDNGVRELYWDGAAWVTAGATDWNTELELQTNLLTFPFDNNSISILTNMVTTDDAVTPKLFAIKLLGWFEFEIYEDLIKTLLMKMADEIRPITDAVSSVLTTTSSFSFTGDYKLQNTYNITDITRLYNKTDDLLEKDNIVDTYTPGALNQDGQTNSPGVVTTTVPIDAGKIVKFKIQYVPEIADYTDEDFYEVANIPLIAFETVEEINRRDGLKTDSHGSTSGFSGLVIKDLANLTAVQVLPPAQIDLRIGYAVFTDSNRDQKRLMERMERFFQENTLLYSFAFDEPYGMNAIQRLEYEAKGATGNLRKATGKFDIRGICMFEQPALDVPLVDNVNVDITT